MKNKYTKPTIVSTDIKSEGLLSSSTKSKPGHGYGAGGHYGPPGLGYTPEHPEKYNEEYEYESELWD